MARVESLRSLHSLALEAKGMKLKLQLITLLSAFLFAGCGSNENNIRMPFAQTEVFEALLQQAE